MLALKAGATAYNYIRRSGLRIRLAGTAFVTPYNYYEALVDNSRFDRQTTGFAARNLRRAPVG